MLTCKVNKATLEIKWKKNGASEIPRAQIDTERVGINILSIPKVETSDSGEYSCEAHNKAGFRSFPVTVKVDGKGDFLDTMNSFFSHKVIFDRVSKVFWNCSGFASIRYMIGLKN